MGKRKRICIVPADITREGEGGQPTKIGESSEHPASVNGETSENSATKYVEHDTEQGAQKKRVHRHTKKTEMWNLSNSHKTLVTFTHFNKPIGDEGNELTQYLGTLVRMYVHVGIDYDDWRKVPIGKKDDMYTMVKPKFSIHPKETPEIKSWIIYSKGKNWSTWKANLKARLYDSSLSVDDMVALQAEKENRVNPIQFEKLAKHWC